MGRQRLERYHSTPITRRETDTHGRWVVTNVIIPKYSAQMCMFQIGTTASVRETASVQTTRVWRVLAKRSRHSQGGRHTKRECWTPSFDIGPCPCSVSAPRLEGTYGFEAPAPSKVSCVECITHVCQMSDVSWKGRSRLMGITDHIQGSKEQSWSHQPEIGSLRGIALVRLGA